MAPRKKKSALAAGDSTESARKPRRVPPRCNTLDGKKWLQNSISVWGDIRKTTEEMRLGHPAMFPAMLVERVIETFSPPGTAVILDPFAGCGSTLVTAQNMRKQAWGAELSDEYAGIALSRLTGSPARTDLQSGQSYAFGATPETAGRLFVGPCQSWLRELEDRSVDLCLSSPPYWNILNQQRTADHQQTRHYGNFPEDLGILEDYGHFLDVLQAIFGDVLRVLKPGGYCCIVVMDLRKKNRFFPFHSDLATRLTSAGFLLDDIVIWNRQAEYNRLRPLGYPSVFRVNKVHEYLLLFQKPKTPVTGANQRNSTP